MNGPTRADGRHNISAATELENPDARLHAAWLAKVSKAADGLGAKPDSKQGGGNTSVSTSSLASADRLGGQEVRLAPPSRLGRRSGLIRFVLIGFIFAVALAAVIAISPQTRPAAAPGIHGKRQQEIEASPSIEPAIVQHPNNRDVVTAAPPISTDPSVWTDRALQAESDDLEVIGLALLYPAFERNVCVPGHNGYPRASDLILGKALKGRSGHQFRDATARPFLHLLIPARRPRRESRQCSWG
jgi:hypothetical protein